MAHTTVINDATGFLGYLNENSANWQGGALDSAGIDQSKLLHAADVMILMSCAVVNMLASFFNAMESSYFWARVMSLAGLSLFLVNLILVWLREFGETASEFELTYLQLPTWSTNVSCCDTFAHCDKPSRQATSPRMSKLPAGQKLTQTSTYVDWSPCVVAGSPLLSSCSLPASLSRALFLYWLPVLPRHCYSLRDSLSLLAGCT